MSSRSEQSRWSRAHAIVDRALDLAPDARSIFTAEQCGADVTLSADVHRWLAGCDEVGHDADHPVAWLSHRLPGLSRSVTALPARIGPYRVIRIAGEGGMGTVFEGERDDGQFRQRVAIKLVHPLIAARSEFIQRFRTERQILATLGHPHIARLLDGGVTEDGAPYCVLEYVDGLPLLRWCDARRLDLRSRLTLFRQICSAVRHAHQRLVVHRDLKPGNVLVSDGGQAMLLDFGLARLLEEDPRTPTITQPGALPTALTPEYASPEQFRGDPLGVSTDIYSLGVILCELLTGRRPFANARGWAALESAVTTAEAPAPSSLSGDVDLAGRRATTPAALKRTLRGDLDGIVGMALEREPERRYQSVEQFDLDLKRYLRGQPVTASQGGAAYRVRKYVRRNRWSVALAALIVLLVSGFSVNAVIQSRRLAVSAAQALAERNSAVEISRLLLGLFKLPFPFDSGGQVRSLRPLLDSAAARITDSSSTLASQRPELLQSLATGYYGLGDFVRAADLARQALITLELRGAGPEAIGEAHLTLAEMLRTGSQERLALPQYDSAITALSVALGPSSARMGRLFLAKARAFQRLGESGAAARELDSAFARFRLDSAGSELGLANAWESRASLAVQAGDLSRADSSYRTTLRLRIQARAPVVEIAGTIGDLGKVARHRGDWRAADSLVRRAIGMKSEALDPDHPETADEYVSLAEIRLAQRRPAEALTLVDRALADYTRAHSTPSWRIHPAQATRARAVAALGRHEAP